jgi:hypothetical protein
MLPRSHKPRSVYETGATSRPTPAVVVDGHLVERDDWKGSDFNAHLRLAANHRFNTEGYQNDPTDTELEERLSRPSRRLSPRPPPTSTPHRCAQEERHHQRTPWILVEPPFQQLNFMGKDLARISEGGPR